MGYRNQEGYCDPTPYEAMKEPERPYRPLVYVCSPYSGDVKSNTQKAIRYSRFAVDKGAIPLAPHLLLPQYMDEQTERDLALFMDLVLLGKCEELWVFGERISTGMQMEIDKAEKRKLPIRYFSEEDLD